MNLAGIDFIEEGHHNKSVEEYGEMLVGGSMKLMSHFNAIINTKEISTCTQKDHNHLLACPSPERKIQSLNPACDEIFLGWVIPGAWR